MRFRNLCKVYIYKKKSSLLHSNYKIKYYNKKSTRKKRTPINCYTSNTQNGPNFFFIFKKEDLGTISLKQNV